MINLYALLGIRFDASPDDIQSAMKKAAQNQTMTLEQLQKCKAWLLNPEVRGKYNEKLLTEYPALAQEVLQENKQLKQQANPVAQSPKRFNTKEETTSNSPSSLHKQRMAVGIAAIIGLASCFMTWVSVGAFVSMTGFNTWPGQTAAGCFMIVALVSVLGKRSEQINPRNRKGVYFFAALLMLVLFIAKITVTNKLEAESDALVVGLARAMFDFGAGYYLSWVAAIGAVTACHALKEEH
ncbi:hypothetical protein [Kingella kingae]|uniref:hypothetical protein n=1 Tax=Kingella kingae TaxID=504 RepID=UPI00254F5B60|nr:hypothetical protein [Kingella kingae]MDK4644438.1 hypothetical protein [Kingella kingae]MDK4671051.1 hypothetical protein [Kingella kingae]